MRIASIKHAVPSRRITNESIIRMVRDHNRARLSGDQLNRLEKDLEAGLVSAGTETRHQLDHGEKAIDFAVRTAQSALEEAAIAPSEVEFLIYAGVGRGWVEPATGAAVQAALGLTNATAFDIMDGCASWLRALHVAATYIRAGAYRRGLIVNCECGLEGYAALDFDAVEQLNHRFAMFTIGEAATATVVTDKPGGNPYFAFHTFGEHLELCTIPLPTAPLFSLGAGDPRCAPGKFFARSRELFTTTIRKIVETFESDPRLRQGRYDICFGHNASEKACDVVARKLGLTHIFFSTHRGYGNTVAAAVPLGMSLALDEGKLRRGDKVLIIVGSAGITVGFATFTF